MKRSEKESGVSGAEGYWGRRAAFRMIQDLN